MVNPTICGEREGGISKNRLSQFQTQETPSAPMKANDGTCKITPNKFVRTIFAIFGRGKFIRTIFSRFNLI